MRISRHSLVPSLVAVIVLCPVASVADMVSFDGAENARNIAEIRIDSTGVHVALEIFPEDVPVFQDVVPDSWFEDRPLPRPPEAERLQHFSWNVLQFVAAGRPLSVAVESVEPRMRKARYSPLVGVLNPYTGRPIPGPPDDKRVLYCELRYAFAGAARPETLVVVPPQGQGGLPRVEFGFRAWHDGVAILDFKHLSQAATLLLDWSDPWYTHFTARALERWQRFGMMTFLYVEPDEVRHEMLVRVRDLMPLVDLGLRDRRWIEADEFRAVEQRISEFLVQHSQVVIDSVLSQGTLDRVNFVRYTRRRTFFLSEPERLSVPQAMLGVVVTHGTEGIPQQVQSRWQLWTDRVQQVPANAIDPAGPFLTYLTPEDPVHTWVNYLKNYEVPTVRPLAVDPNEQPWRLPVLSAILMGVLIPVVRRAAQRRSSVATLISVALLVAVVLAWSRVTLDVPRPGSAALSEPERAESLVQQLLQNVYRAFDARDEATVYDRLAHSVHGELLEQIYLDNRRAFEVQQAGGAQASVQHVEVEDLQVERQGSGYRMRTQWIASGSVGHWGHVHVRTNRYDADVMVEPVEGAWRIVAMDVRSEERLDPQADAGDDPSSP